MKPFQSSSRSTLPNIVPYLNPLSLVLNLWRYRDLIAQFTVREVEGRYRGSFLGVLWSFANPLLMLTTYTFVFGVVFRSRWGGSAQNLGEFALIVFCGLIAFNFFGECVNRAGGLIVAVPSYVKKVVFPLEVLPVSVLGSALFHGLVSLTVLFAGVLLATHRLPPTVPLLPVVAVPLVFFSLGVSWFLAGLGVFLRDIQHLVTLLVQIMLFATPIFYSLETVPEPLKRAIKLNPLTPAVENFRRVILWGILPAWTELIICTFVSASVLLLGYAWFMRTKKGFADVV